MLLTAPLDVRTEAQQSSGIAGWGEVAAGSAIEDYLRVLQVAGVVAPYSWSVRGFSPREIAGLAPADSADHPWRGHEVFRPAAADGPVIGWVRPRAEAIYNSALPYGANDGAVWAGRGLTGVAQVGVSVRVGPVSAVVAPVGFYAANEAFDLIGTGRLGPAAFADGYTPGTIDTPQRFGDEPYYRLDPGHTTIRADLDLVTLGVSTANQVWGPGIELPLLLGTNAPGFVHLFAGTSHPLGAGIGTVHGRVFWGRLDQSEYSAYVGDTRRFATGVVGAFVPRGIPGLEIGASRFFHNSWPADGISPRNLLQPFGAVLKQRILPPGDSLSLDTTGEENQLASAFLRWVFPASGVEVFGEFLREDHSYDVRDLVLEPDHNSGFMLGLRKVWLRSPGTLYSLNVETVDGRRSHLSRVRGQSALYTHGPLVQGHTQRGQLLGSVIGLGGAGSVVAVERYSSRGAVGARWERRGVGEVHPSSAEAGGLNVLHAFGTHVTWFAGRFDLIADVTAVYEFNRGGSEDRASLRGTFGLRANP